MSYPQCDLIVLRYGELFLKGTNRPQFEELLARNVRRALAALPVVRVDRVHGRLFVRCAPADAPAILEKARQVFGLSSASPAVAVPSDLEPMTAAALELARCTIEERRPRTFRVSARRSDKQFTHTSPEIGRLIGAAIYEATHVPVDLTTPDLVVGVEVGRERSFVFVDTLPGPGGLPVGSSGRVALLLSGGIDSPVAGYLMQKRGCIIDAVYFHSPPYVGARTRAKVEELAAKLAPAQGDLSLDVVRFTEVQSAIRDRGPLELAVVLYRRAMMRIASALARRHGCGALATGENLGQVASQTLENLVCIERAAELAVLRPLLTYDKVETIALAQRIGTYDLSIEPYDDCCSLFVPRHPVTRARLEIVERVEGGLDLAPLIEQAVAGTETVKIGSESGSRGVGMSR